MSSYDYSQLTPPERSMAESSRDSIKAVMRQTAIGIITIGHALNVAKLALPHGEWGKWLKAEFNWSHDTANNFQRVAKRFPRIPEDSAFEATALYLLAHDDTPQEARDKAIEMAEQGIKITKGVAKILVDKVLEAQTRVIEEALTSKSVSLGGQSHDLIKGALTETLCEGVLQRQNQIAEHVERQADKDLLISVLKNAVVSDARMSEEFVMLKLTLDDAADLAMFIQMYQQTAGSLRLTLTFKPDQPIIDIESEDAA